MKLLAFAGRKGSGKNTAASLLTDYYPVSFAAPLKLMLSTLLEYRGADSVTINRMLEGDLKEVPTPLLNGQTPRYALQTLGTQWGREIMHNDLWIDAFSDKAQQYHSVVCTDCRFPNEVQRIHEMGGKVALINRGESAYDEHESENHIDTLDVDFVIDNTSTLEYLELQVREFEGKL